MGHSNKSADGRLHCCQLIGASIGRKGPPRLWLYLNMLHRQSRGKVWFFNNTPAQHHTSPHTSHARTIQAMQPYALPGSYEQWDIRRQAGRQAGGNSLPHL